MKRCHWTEGTPKVKQRAISIQPSGKVIGKDWFVESINDFDLWLIMDGGADLTMEEGKTVRLHRGSCLWLSPGVEFDLRVCDGETLTTGWVHFDLLNAAGKLIDPAQVEIPSSYCEILNMAYFESALRRLILMWHESGRTIVPMREPSGQHASHLLKALLYEFQTAHEQQETLVHTGARKHHHQVISSAVSWLYSHPEQVVSVSHMAKKFGYSPKHFTRIFREMTGKTPTQALIKARIDRAKTLLSNSMLNISEIAESLLYENVFYFSKQFKQVIGVSPQQFRNQILKPTPRQSVKKPTLEPPRN